MGALETRQHHRMILIEELEKFEKYAELMDVLDKIRTGNTVTASTLASTRRASPRKKNWEQIMRGHSKDELRTSRVAKGISKNWNPIRKK